jgi:hypothetical protein
MAQKSGDEGLERRIKKLEQDALGRMQVGKALKQDAEQIDFSKSRAGKSPFGLW